jgi:hypothetical protein
MRASYRSVLLNRITKIDSLYYDAIHAEDHHMFVHHCPACSSDWLQSSGSILQLTNTAEGPVGLVRCHRGHLAVVNFRTNEAVEAATADVASETFARA